MLLSAVLRSPSVHLKKQLFVDVQRSLVRDQGINGPDPAEPRGLRHPNTARQLSWNPDNQLLTRTKSPRSRPSGNAHAQTERLMTSEDRAVPLGHDVIRKETFYTLKPKEPLNVSTGLSKKYLNIKKEGRKKKCWFEWPLAGWAEGNPADLEPAQRSR